METITPTSNAKVGTLNLPKTPGAATNDSTQAAATPFGDTDRAGQDLTNMGESRQSYTTRFPPRDADGEAESNLGTKVEGFLSGQDWAESARDAVRDHPLAVVGIALVAGLLVGRL